MTKIAIFLSLLFLSLAFLFISCNPPTNQNEKSEDKKTNNVTNKQDAKDTKKSDAFDKLAKNKDTSELDTEYIKKEGIIKTDVVVSNPITKVKVEDFRVRISQIDNSRFPEVTLVVSVTDTKGNPLIVGNPDFFQLEEHGKLIPKENIVSVVQKKDVKSESQQLPLNAILAIDKSGSMRGNTTDEDKMPLTFAKSAAVQFINQIHDTDLVKVIAFDGDIHSLSANKDAIEMISNLKPKGSTALYGALLTGVKMLEAGRGIKAMILLSDGKNDTRGTISKTIKEITLQDGIYAAEQLAVPVFTIGFGADFDEETLLRIAQDTHALFFKTAKKEEITELYDQIRNIINTQYMITYRSDSLQPVTDVTARLGLFKDRRTFTTPEHVIKREKELRQQIAVVKSEKDRLLQLEQDLKNQMAELNRKEDKLEQRKASLNEEEKRVEDLLKDVNKKEKELTRFDDTLKKLESDLAEEKNRLAKEKDEIESRIAELNDRENKLDERKTAQQQREQSLDQRDDNLNKKNTQLEDRDSKLDGREKDIQTEEAKLTQLRVKLEGKEKDLDGKIKQNDDLKSKLQAQRAAVNKEKERLANLKSSLDSVLKEIQSKHSTAIEQIQKQKSELETIKP